MPNPPVDIQVLKIHAVTFSQFKNAFFCLRLSPRLLPPSSLGAHMVPCSLSPSSCSGFSPCFCRLPLPEGSPQTPGPCPLGSGEAWILRCSWAPQCRALLGSQLQGPGAGGRRSVSVCPLGRVGPLAARGRVGLQHLLLASPPHTLPSVWDPCLDWSPGARTEGLVLPAAETRPAPALPLEGRGLR